MKVFHIRPLWAARYRIVAVGIIYAILTSGLPMNHTCQDVALHDNTCAQGHACSSHIRPCTDKEPAHASIDGTHDVCAACQFSLLAKSTGAMDIYTWSHPDIVPILHPVASEAVIQPYQYLASHPLRAPPRITG
jgi:hypothetical protein